MPGDCFEYTVAVCEPAIAREFVVCGYAVDERHMTLRAPVLEASRDIREPLNKSWHICLAYEIAEPYVTNLANNPRYRLRFVP